MPEKAQKRLIIELDYYEYPPMVLPPHLPTLARMEVDPLATEARQMSAVRGDTFSPPASRRLSRVQVVQLDIPRYGESNADSMPVSSHESAYKMTRFFLLFALATLSCGMPLTVAVPVEYRDAILPPVSAPTPPTANSVDGYKVLVTAETVHIRTADGLPSGEYAVIGDVLRIKEFRADGWAVILDPPEWNSFIIWRGCTSSPAEFGCSSEAE
jgi:hypothetical protein